MSSPNVIVPAQGAPEQIKPANIPNSETASPEAAATKKDAALHDAFTLGWGIVELKSRIQGALVKPSDTGLRLASVWRASFNRIAALQVKAFKTNSTAKTLYEPPGPDNLPYLYPPESDYANVGGISNYPDVGIVVPKDAEGKDILADFKLYEVTRRAINCLTLLYVREDESLIPDVIKRDQDHLVNAILTAAQDKGGGGGDTQPTGDATKPQDSLQQAKQALTERTSKFLDAWDGYLRENYYVGGSIPNNDLELVAYEAGHSMSSLSWGIAVATEPFEQQAEVAAPQSPQTETDPLSAKFIEAWQKVFRDQDVIRLQHQITALSSALDDAYYLQHSEQERPADGAVLVALNPDLPSQTILAVKHSLDYWQNTVKWIAKPGSLENLRKLMAPDAAHWSKSMRMALNEQANIWQTLLTGQQSLRAYSMESVTHNIMQDVTGQIQKSLRTGFSASVQQAEKLAQDLAQEAKDALKHAKDAALNGLEELFALSRRRVFWLVGGVIILFALLLLSVALTRNQASNSALSSVSGGVGISGVISAILGYFGLGKLQGVKEARQANINVAHDTAEQKVNSQATAAGEAGAGAGEGNLLTRIEGAAEQTGKMILEALENGYKQARIELDGLSRSMAVSYPLVEFFVSVSTLEGDVSLLTEIIWSRMERDEEIARVTRAAFGPLAVFITPSNKDSENGGDNKPTDKGSVNGDNSKPKT